MLVVDDNTSSVTPGITVGTGASAAVLLVDDGTVSSGAGTGTMTIGPNGTLDVEKGTSGPGATLDGVLVADDNTVTSGITVGSGASAATLLLDDGTTIKGGGTGTMTIGADGTLDVERNTSGPPDATLDGMVVTNNNTSATTPGITVGTSSTATLRLDDGTTLSGGTMTIGASGTLGIAHNSVTGADATLNGVNETDSGTIKVSNGAKLTLAGTDTITGSIFAFDDGRAQAAAGGAVFMSQLSIGDLNAGNPTVTLEMKASSGSFAFATSDANVTFGGSGDDITLTGPLNDINSLLKAGFTYRPVDSPNTLTLTVTDPPAATAHLPNSTSIPRIPAPSFTVANARGAIRNASTIEISGQTTLNSDSVFNGGAMLVIDATGVLKLDHTAVFGGTGGGGTITDNNTLEITAHSGLFNTTTNAAAPSS